MGVTTNDDEVLIEMENNIMRALYTEKIEISKNVINNYGTMRIGIMN